MTSDKEAPRTSVDRSRDSREGAGWSCQQTGSFEPSMRRELENYMPRQGWERHHSWLNRNRHFSWLNPLTWWRSRNDVIAHLLTDPINEERHRLISALLKRDDVPKDFI